MKKVMFVVLALVFAVSAFAQTSNKVGFVKITASGSGTPGTSSSTAFGLPFRTWQVVSNVPQWNTDSWRASDVIGPQITPGGATTADKLVSQNNLLEARLTTTGSWLGGLQTSNAMGPGHAYWIQNKSGAAYPLVVAGEVANGGYTPYLGDITVTAPSGGATVASTPVSWRDARVVDVWMLNLKSDGFTGGTTTQTDKLVEQGTLYEARCTAAAVDGSSTGWSGDLSTGGIDPPNRKGEKPGKAYWIQNKHATSWVYHYDGGPALLSVGGSGNEVPAPAISKVPTAPAKINVIDNMKAAPAKAASGTTSKGSVKK